jgi:hypothetical protein
MLFLFLRNLLSYRMSIFKQFYHNILGVQDKKLKINFYLYFIHCCPIKVNKKEAIKMASQLKS